jgi:hypothetical protein
VIEQGTYDELISSEGGEVKRILKDSSTGGTSAEKSVEAVKVAEELDEEKPAVPAQERKEAKALLTKEERNIGAVRFPVYLKYLRDGGGLFTFVFVYFAFILCAVNSIASTSWVSFWTSDPTYQRFSVGLYLGIYGALAGKRLIA